MKKVVVLLLTLVMIASFTACGRSEVSSSDDDAGKSNTKVELVEDLGGYQFTVACAMYGDEADWWDKGTEYGSAVNKVFDEIESAYNCKIVFDYYEPTTIVNSLRSSVMSGEKFADIVVGNLFNFGTAYANDLLHRAL